MTRMRSLLMLLASACLLLVTGGPSIRAEGDSFLTRDPTLQRGRIFLAPQPRAQPVQRQRVAPVRRNAAANREQAAIQTIDVAHHILVVGDFGHLLAGGLEDALNDRPDVAVVSRTRSDSGLVRADFYDWPAQIAQVLASEQKISIAVVMLGLNDRQTLREGDIVHEPLSPRWTELYRLRVEAVAAAFAARKIPLVWVGAPPVQNTRLSTDFIAFNAIYRSEAEKTGGAFVDLWGAFVDAENRYAATGPDVSGQSMRLRTGDGIHFTAAGARKAAHFVDVVIRRLIEGRPQQTVLSLPVSPETGAPLSPELQPGGVERLIDAMVDHQLSSIGLAPALQAKPVAGPVLPLTAQLLPGDGALLGSVAEARGRGETAAELNRIFGEGRLPEPKPGRLDDHRWPR